MNGAKRTDVIIIGGGQAGLAMSHCLSVRGVDHLVLERGRVGQRWRNERWDSLRLLTPNWQSRLPGFSYQGNDPDGYMSATEVVGYLNQYASSFTAPILSGATVHSVRGGDSGYAVDTSLGSFAARAIVIATGHAGEPAVPALASGLSDDLAQVVPTRYRRPEQLPDGGVLVVGASATGVQLAREIHRSGRPVTVSVGRHTRLPRTYRGRDIMWWLDRSGILTEPADERRDMTRAREQPSLQLVGSDDRHNLDLGLLQAEGVRLVGRAVEANGHQMRFANDLQQTTRSADAKLLQLIRRIDRFAVKAGLSKSAAPADVPSPLSLGATAPVRVDLRERAITSIVWATGFRRSYPWLHVPVLDERGELIHHGGITSAPGLYTLGLRFMRRRNSNYIDGVGADAEFLAGHITNKFSISGKRIAA